ncbi:MAG: zinc ribbon domain-containing protein [Pyrinomonadaceae bacterium]
MTAELEKLIELQKTDTNIRKLKKSIETAEQRRAGIEQEFERHAFEIRGIQNQSETAKTERADLERQIAEAKTSLERANRNLKNAQNQKEYEAAMREADVLQKQINALETQTLEKMGTVEEVEKTLTSRADEISSIEIDRQKSLADFDKEVEKQKKEFEAETKKRQEIFVTLPTNLATVYDRLAKRSRDGIAVAEVINGACSACFMSFRPQVLVELRTSDKIITCESCTRILYIEPKPTQTEAATK